MERVALLVEETSERLRCLLNPESLVLRRRAGIQPRRSVTGHVTGAGLADDPLLYTGGGSTELELDLLFDVHLAGTSIASEDVRDLTGPLWRLAENAGQGDRRPPLVRFIWGKSWNIPGVVVAVAERLEHFTPGGVPRRSWLRLRLLRAEAPSGRDRARQPALSPLAMMAALPAPSAAAPGGAERVHELLGGTGEAVGVVAAVPELSISGSLVVAADIIAAAVAETPVGRWLAGAWRTITGAVDDIVTRFKDWWATPSPVTQAIKNGLARLGKAAAALASAAQGKIVAVATAVGAQISAAVKAMSATLRKLTAPAERAIAAAMEPILDNLRPVARGLAQAAAVVAAAVRAKVKRIVAAAVPYLEAGRRAVAETLQQIGTAISAAGSRAVDDIRVALGVLGDGLTQAQTAGKFVAMEVIGPALGQIAAGADALWSAGSRAAAKGIAGIVGGLATAFKNLLEAGEALTAVSAAAITPPVAAAADGLTAAVEKRAAGDPAGVNLVAEAWGELESQVDALAPVAPPAAQAPITEAAEAIRQALPALDTPGGPAAAVVVIKAALQKLSAALAVLPAVEEQAIHALVQEAAAPGEPLAPPASPSSDTARRAAGERLDQLAFRYYADPAFWRLLAVANGIDDPLHLATGRLLRVPTTPARAQP